MNPSARTSLGQKPSQLFRRNLYRSPVSLCVLLLLLAVFGSRIAYATTYTVTDTTDNPTDTGSLRYAVNTAVDGDTINFLNVIGTITLVPANGPLTIAHSITITGPGAGLLTISGNNAVTVFNIAGGATVSIEKLNIANGNTSTYGGAIDSAGTLTLIQCAFSGNTSTYGGAIFSVGTLTVTDSTFSGNTSTPGSGGAIASNGALTVKDSTFFGNTSDVGGGISGENATVENSTFFGNIASAGLGGGIFNNGGIFTVNNSTVTGNMGDGIRSNGGILTVTNSIVAGNTGGDCDDCGTQSANNMIGGTPDLGPLQYNGWITQTMMPLPGSPAIGAGSGSTLATDQRGFARPIGSGVVSDLGAVQTNYLTVTNLNDSGTGSLRDAITTAISDGSADIVFQSGLTGTIMLASTLPAIVTSHVNLEGSGAKLLTVSDAPPPANFEVLDISGTAAVVNLRGLTIANGNAAGLGGGLSNSGLLTVEYSAFSYNDGAEGGAVFNEGSLIVENSTFSSNLGDSGGGILNQGTLIAVNATFSGNRAYSGNGGGVSNAGGTALLYNSTFSGNQVLDSGVGGGIYNSGPLLLENTIVSGNTNLQSNTADDCSGCGTQSGTNLIGGTAGLGALVYNGLNATVQTLLPLPGSAVIQAGDPTQLLPGVNTDERGFPRLTAGKLDLGAAQTNYTSVNFVQQPTNTDFNADITPAVTVEALETNTNLSAPNNTDAVSGIPLTLTFNGTGTLGGTLTQTTNGGVASFADLNVNATGTGDTLATSLTVVAGQMLTATSSPFNITLLTQTVTFNPLPPTSVAYGVGPITLSATSSAGLPVTYQVDSGPATIQGNRLTITGARTVVIEADAAGNSTYAPAAPATATILVGLGTSQLALTASTTQTSTGGSVTLTATATSTTGGTPTGAVTFMANGNFLGGATLNAGVAKLAVTTLPVGSNIITASYPGDANFLGSTAQLNTPIVVGTASFSMAVAPTSLVIQSGHYGMATVTLTPTFGYTGTVNFSCSGLPRNSNCHFQPSSVSLSGSGGPVRVTVAIQIGVPVNARSKTVAWLRSTKPLHSLPILPAMFFWLPGTDWAIEDRNDASQKRTKRKSGRMLWLVLLFALSLGALGTIGCSNLSPNPPAGQYTVNIIALGSNGINQSAPVQVTIP